MGGFSDIHALLEGTAAFYRVTKARLDEDLNGLSSRLRLHFSAEQDADRNFYTESIDRNLGYLEHVVRMERQRRLASLKRGGVVEKVLEMKGDL